MKQVFVFCGLLLAGTALLPQVHGQPPPVPSDLMEQKLVNSQLILSGLAREDFPAIVRGAEAMNRLSQRQWLRDDTPNYRAQLKVFRFANEELIRLSEEENLDGATLAYVQQTLSCINCHKYIRNHSK